MPERGVAKLLGAVVAAGLVAGPAQGSDVVLVPHRAVYDLKLAQTKKGSSVTAVRGRILYDFSGSACEGYGLVFRQVSELNNGEGRVTLTDLRSNTWEDGTGRTYKFQSQNYINQRLVDTVDGQAERRADRVAVTLTKPQAQTTDLEPLITFPTEHMVRIIRAAREERRLLEAPVYDGSEKGEKVYSTLTIIGREIAADQRRLTDAAAGRPELAGVRRWPVTISYFDRAKSGGEQLPSYSLSFELYDNGISRDLVLDYDNFAIGGDMTSLEIKPSKPCP